MTKLWRVPGVNMELHTAETCDRPGAYLVAHLPETERPITIRALKRVAMEHDARGGPGVAASMSPVDVLGILETMPLADRFVPPPKAPEIAPPTAEEVAAVEAAMFGKWSGDAEGLEAGQDIARILGMFVDMRNEAA